MNIDPTNSIKPPAQVVKRAVETSGGVAKPAREVGHSGESLSLNLTALMEEARSAPDVDMSRVEKIKANLAQGDYPIDASRIARKMLEQDESIFGAGK
jgi:flagellar biosynthesis anti-sigma factor FlgM